MASKRIKISFGEVNEGRYTVISRDETSRTNERVKREMGNVVKEYEKKDSISHRNASKLVLNK